jgi:hypothetical protein
MAATVITSTGTTVTLEPSVHGPLVILDNPNAPADMRNIEAGRITDGGYQSAPFSLGALTPETLRAIAHLIEQAA